MSHSSIFYRETFKYFLQGDFLSILCRETFKYSQVFSAGRRNGAFFGGVGGVLTGGNGAGFFFVLGMGWEETVAPPWEFEF